MKWTWAEVINHKISCTEIMKWTCTEVKQTKDNLSWSEVKSNPYITDIPYYSYVPYNLYFLYIPDIPYFSLLVDITNFHKNPDIAYFPIFLIFPNFHIFLMLPTTCPGPSRSRSRGAPANQPSKTTDGALGISSSKSRQYLTGEKIGNSFLGRKTGS